jgi:hypothetical protein
MATNSVSTLKSLLVPSKATEVDYPGLSGFKINVVFLSRETLVSIRKKATKTVYKNRAATEEVDDKLFLQLYVQSTIKGWSGLKMAHVNELAPIDMTAVDPESLLDYSEDNALELMRASGDFDSFITETVSELSNFTKTSTSK